MSFCVYLEGVCISEAMFHSMSRHCWIYSDQVKNSIYILKEHILKMKKSEVMERLKFASSKIVVK